jgi:hypothetical protein
MVPPAGVALKFRSETESDKKTSGYNPRPTAGVLRGRRLHSRLSKGKGLYFYHRPEWRVLPMQTNSESLKQRINELHLEHRDLDDVIARLAEKPGQDQLQLQRLKKKKLLIKDQISHLERQLTPDIRA